MKPAVSYNLHGMLAGCKVIHREVKGNQMWLVRLAIIDQHGEAHESEAVSPEPVPLPAIGPIAMKFLDEYLAENGNVVRAAGWTAYVIPNPSKKKAVDEDKKKKQRKEAKKARKRNK